MICSSTVAGGKAASHARHLRWCQPQSVDCVESSAAPFLTGRPANIIEQLKAVEKRYPGVDRVVCATPLGTPLEVQLEDLDRFAKEVMPAFRPAKIAAAAE